jgi:nuclear RNA export factor
MTARGQASRQPPRGPAASRRKALKADRDGDVAMGTAIKGQARIGKTNSANARKELLSRPSRGDKAGILTENARRAIIKHAGAGDISMKETRPTASRAGLVELKVTGWENSKAATAADGGVSALIKWLEKKASQKLGSRAKEVKIKKVCFRHEFDNRYATTGLIATVSGPLSFAANLRTTTAIPVNS